MLGVYKGQDPVVVVRDAEAATTEGGKPDELPALHAAGLTEE
jgi:hypothetical protein